MVFPSLLFFNASKKYLLIVMEHLETDEQPSFKTIWVCIYRINEYLETPYLEYFVETMATDNPTTEEVHSAFPETTLQEGDLLPEEIETHFFLLTCELLGFEDEQILQRNDLPIYFQGFLNTPDNTYALVEVGREIKVPNSNWCIVNQIKNQPEFVPFFKIDPALTKIQGTPSPLCVYHSSPILVRHEMPHFGFVFVVSETSIGEFKYPVILFPANLKTTCFIQKKELQDFPPEVLEAHYNRFMSVEAIQFTQEGVLYWCIKDVLAFFQTDEIHQVPVQQMMEAELAPLTGVE